MLCFAVRNNNAWRTNSERRLVRIKANKNSERKGEILHWFSLTFYLNRQFVIFQNLNLIPGSAWTVILQCTLGRFCKEWSDFSLPAWSKGNSSAVCTHCKHILSCHKRFRVRRILQLLPSCTYIGRRILPSRVCVTKSASTCKNKSFISFSFSGFHWTEAFQENKWV